jgi:putative transposase
MPSTLSPYSALHCPQGKELGEVPAVEGLQARYCWPKANLPLCNRRRGADGAEPIWGHKCPHISRSWRAHWDNLNTLFDYPDDIRKAIDTTNAIESLNSVIRKAIKKRKLFPTDDAPKKVIYLALEDTPKNWTMPIRNWKTAMNNFIIQFEGQPKD